MSSLTYHYDKQPNRSAYDVRMGLVYIAHIWCPDKRANRDKFLVRLLYNQKVGSVDFSKDKQFDSLEQAKAHIERNFKSFIKDIGYSLGLWATRT